MRAAVIGIGSNSVRMLVAEAADGEIRRISRDRAGTRLFAGLDEAGNLSREAMASSCAAVKQMADSARSQGAEKCISLPPAPRVTPPTARISRRCSKPKPA